MFTLPVVLSGVSIMLGYAVFQFSLFRWLISRIDSLGVSFKEELVRHQASDTEALREVRAEIVALRAPKLRRK